MSTVSLHYDDFKFLLHSVNLILFTHLLVTLSCTHHLITVPTFYHSLDISLQTRNLSVSQILSSIVFLVPFGLPSPILDLDGTRWALAFVCFSFFFYIRLTFLFFFVTCATRQKACARQKAVELTTIWKDKNVTSALKIRVMMSMVWVVFQYGVEG